MHRIDSNLYISQFNIILLKWMITNILLHEQSAKFVLRGHWAGDKVTTDWVMIARSPRVPLSW